MQRRPPTPVCKAFVVCRQIFRDDLTDEVTLVAPVHEFTAPRFPLGLDLSVFARWSNAHGTYSVELQLRTLAGDVVWAQLMEKPFEVHDPLLVVRVTLRHHTVVFPRPGKYEFALLANGEDVAADTFVVREPGSGAG